MHYRGNWQYEQLQPGNIFVGVNLFLYLMPSLLCKHQIVLCFWVKSLIRSQGKINPSMHRTFYFLFFIFVSRSMLFFPPQILTSALQLPNRHASRIHLSSLRWVREENKKGPFHQSLYSWWSLFAIPSRRSPGSLVKSSTYLPKFKICAE